MLPSEALIDPVDHRPLKVEPAFNHVLCGIDGNPPSTEAARQAAELVRPGGRVNLLAVTSGAGAREHMPDMLTGSEARIALEVARYEMRPAGASAAQRAIQAHDATAGLLQQSVGHDLLAIGANSGTHEAGVFLGRTASALVHSADLPVLIARPAPSDAPFPKKILLAGDGSPESHRAALLTARVASAHRSVVTIVRVDGPTAGDRESLARDVDVLHTATGREPTVVETSGSPEEQIAGLAARLGVSVVVLGSRGLKGWRAILSVSERAVRTCPCSVLVARPQNKRGEPCS